MEKLTRSSGLRVGDPVSTVRRLSICWASDKAAIVSSENCPQQMLVANPTIKRGKHSKSVVAVFLQTRMPYQTSLWSERVNPSSSQQVWFLHRKALVMMTKISTTNNNAHSKNSMQAKDSKFQSLSKIKKLSGWFTTIHTNHSRTPLWSIHQNRQQRSNWCNIKTIIRQASATWLKMSITCRAAS